MAKDAQDIARELLSRAVDNFNVSPPRGKGHGGASGLLDGIKRSSGAIEAKRHGGSGPFDGMRGVAAGAGAAALIPAAAKLIRSGGGAGGRLAAAPGDAASKLGSALGDKVTSKVDEAGGASGIAKNAVKDALPFGGGDEDDQSAGGGKGGAAGVGKGRRMPVQQSVDIGVPLETVYNQWTQFEDWPNFMHRVTRVTQEDDTTISFATKIWGKTKEFTATIETQRPDQRIKWKVSQGLTHQGVVTFHELAPNLTRVLLNMDVEPGGLLEKAARGMRHVKRAARADLHRFKAFIEMNEKETGAWRGVIEDGEVVEEHDPSYDEDREYADVEELTGQSDSDSSDEGNEEEPEARGKDDDEGGEEEERPRPRRRSRATSSNGSGPSSGRSSSSGSRSRSRSSSNSGDSSNSRSSSSRSSSSRSASSRSSGNGHSGRRRSGSGSRQSS